MVHALSNDEIEYAHTTALQSDLETVQVLGLLAYRAGIIEHQISRVLCHLLGFRNFENFGVVASGLPIRTTIDRIRKAAKLRGTMVGPNFGARLNYFQGHISPMRNDLFHNSVKKEGKYLICRQIDRMGADDKGIWPNAMEPPRYEIIDIKRKTLWLETFFTDLDRVAEKTWNGEAPEIDRPQSSLPPASGRANGC